MARGSSQDSHFELSGQVRGYINPNPLAPVHLSSHNHLSSEEESVRVFVLNKSNPSIIGETLRHHECSGHPSCPPCQPTSPIFPIARQIGSRLIFCQGVFRACPGRSRAGTEFNKRT